MVQKPLKKNNPLSHAGIDKIIDFFRAVSNFFYVTNADRSSTKTGKLLFNLLTDFARKILMFKRKEIYPRDSESDHINYPDLSYEKIDKFIDITIELILRSYFS